MPTGSGSLVLTSPSNRRRYSPDELGVCLTVPMFCWKIPSSAGDEKMVPKRHHLFYLAAAQG